MKLPRPGTVAGRRSQDRWRACKTMGRPAPWDFVAPLEDVVARIVRQAAASPYCESIDATAAALADIEARCPEGRGLSRQDLRILRYRRALEKADAAWRDIVSAGGLPADFLTSAETGRFLDAACEVIDAAVAGGDDVLRADASLRRSTGWRPITNANERGAA